MREHGVSINITIVMNNRKMEKSVSYGSHNSEMKGKYFVREEISEQLQAGHAAIFFMAKVWHLKGLCIYPLAEIMQMGRKSRLIYIFHGAA